MPENRSPRRSHSIRVARPNGKRSLVGGSIHRIDVPSTAEKRRLPPRRASQGLSNRRSDIDTSGLSGGWSITNRVSIHAFFSQGFGPHDYQTAHYLNQSARKTLLQPAAVQLLPSPQRDPDRNRPRAPSPRGWREGSPGILDVDTQGSLTIVSLAHNIPGRSAVNQEFRCDDRWREKSSGSIEQSKPGLFSNVRNMTKIPCDEIVDLVKGGQCHVNSIRKVLSMKDAP